MNENEKDEITQLIDGIVDDTLSSIDISDNIKNIIFGKAAEKIEAIRPSVYNASFGDESAE